MSRHVAGADLAGRRVAHRPVASLANRLRRATRGHALGLLRADLVGSSSAGPSPCTTTTGGRSSPPGAADGASGDVGRLHALARLDERSSNTRLTQSRRPSTERKFCWICVRPAGERPALDLVVDRDVRAAEAVDRLLRIADDDEPARARDAPSPSTSRQQQRELGLDRVGVLELVDQHAAVAAAGSTRGPPGCGSRSRAQMSRSSKSATPSARRRCGVVARRTPRRAARRRRSPRRAARRAKRAIALADRLGRRCGPRRARRRRPVALARRALLARSAARNSTQPLDLDADRRVARAAPRPRR